MLLLNFIFFNSFEFKSKKVYYCYTFIICVCWDFRPSLKQPSNQCGNSGKYRKIILLIIGNPWEYPLYWWGKLYCAATRKLSKSFSVYEKRFNQVQSSKVMVWFDFWVIFIQKRIKLVLPEILQPWTIQHFVQGFTLQQD